MALGVVPDHMVAIENRIDQQQRIFTDIVSHAEPGNPREQGQAGKKQRQVQYRGTEETEPLGEIVAGNLSEYATGVCRHRTRVDAKIQAR